MFTARRSTATKALSVLLVALLALMAAPFGSASAQEDVPLPTIAEIALGDPDNFSTLVSLLGKAGLVDTVADPAQDLTVFAPTNAAFAALDQQTLDALGADPAKLTEVLLYHVSAGSQDAATLRAAGTANTLQGEAVQVDIRNEAVFINDSQVVIANVAASNGIVHVIDAVLTVPEPEPPAAVTIADVALGDPDNFSTLVAALTAASNAGPVDFLATVSDPNANLTVFAPTNAAFAALGQDTIDALLADPSGQLTDILLYHVLGSRQDGAALAAAGSATTLLGDDVTATVRDGNVFINESQVVIADVQTDNGIIHVIDAVLLPPVPEPPTPPTIAEIAVNDPDNFSTLVAALSAAGLVDAVADPNADLTVFAPTNAAFAALGQDTIDALLADPTGQLTDILLYHVAPPAQDGATLAAAGNATTLLGEDVTVTVRDGHVYINDSKVIIADIEASNGIIHVIDAVLLPPVPEPPTPPTIAEIAVNDPDNFSTLVAALSAAGLVDAVADPNADLTVFAPTNAAFAALGQDTIDALLADPTGQLTDILLYHVAPPAQDGATLAAAGSATTLLGDDVTVTVQDGHVYINDSKVIIADIEASNGIIHVIDAVLLPPADEEPVLFDGARVNIISAVSDRYLDGDRGWWRTNVDTSTTPRLDDEWILEATGNGTWRLQNAKLHRYLDADNKRRGYNVDLARRTARGTEWEIIEQANGNYLLRTVAFDRYLDYDRYNVDTSSQPGADDEWRIVIAAGH